jgi:hypothetical protein
MEWRLLYNSQKHGISFSTFLGRLGEAAPTLLLIRYATWQDTILLVPGSSWVD